MTTAQAGAPKGNLNGVKHGKRSAQLRFIIGELSKPMRRVTRYVRAVDMSKQPRRRYTVRLLTFTRRRSTKRLRASRPSAYRAGCCVTNWTA